MTVWLYNRVLSCLCRYETCMIVYYCVCVVDRYGTWRQW